MKCDIVGMVPLFNKGESCTKWILIRELDIFITIFLGKISIKERSNFTGRREEIIIKNLEIPDDLAKAYQDEFKRRKLFTELYYNPAKQFVNSGLKCNSANNYF